MTQSNKRIYVCLAWLVIVVVFVSLRINLISIPLDRDEGNFGYTGQVILDGGIPYRDVYDHKPPVVFYLYAAALMLFPPTPTGIHIFLHLYNLMTLVVIFLAVKMYTGRLRSALWAALVFGVFSSVPSIQGFTASSEMLMLLPVCLGLLFAVAAVRRHRLAYAFLSGLSAAVACWTKQTGIFLGCFLLLFIVMSHLTGKPPENRNIGLAVRSGLVWLLGFTTVSLLIVTYFSYQGVLDEFFYWSFVHGYYYSSAISSNYLPVLKRLGDVLAGNAPLFVLSLAFLVPGLFKKLPGAVFAAGFLFFSLAATVPGYAYRHYLAQLAPALAVAGGIGIVFWEDKFSFGRSKPLCLAVVLLLLVGWPLTAHYDYYFNRSPDAFLRRFFGTNLFPESIKIAEFIQRRTMKGSTVFIAGSEPQILMYAERKSATGFVMVYPLTWSFPRYMEFQRQAWREIQSNTPEMIVLVSLQSSQLWDGRAELWWYKMIDEEIVKHYRLTAVTTIKDPVGDVIPVASRSQLEKIKAENDCPIYIFRRN